MNVSLNLVSITFSQGRSRIRSRSSPQDRSSLHMSTRVRAEALAQRQDVPPRLAALHDRAQHPDRNWQGQEPVAQCGRTLRSLVAVLRHEGDELLHRAYRSQQSSW